MMRDVSVFLVNLLLVTVASGLLFGAYKLLFSNENRFNFMRVFLIGSLLFSFILPSLRLDFSAWGTHDWGITHQLVNLLSSTSATQESATPVFLDEVVVSATRINFGMVLLGIYWLGVLVSISLLIYKLLKIRHLYCISTKMRDGKYTIVHTGKNHICFSFFHFIFLPDGEISSMVLLHEKSHADQWHSLDVIVVELLTVFQWFNPFMHMYKNELQTIHECAADENVLKEDIKVSDYMTLILQQCTAQKFSAIGNNFSFQLTKKRFQMMTKQIKSKGFGWRIVAMLPVLAILLVANSKAVAVEHQKYVETTAVVSQPQNSSKLAFTESTRDAVPVFTPAEKSSQLDSDEYQKPDSIRNKKGKTPSSPVVVATDEKGEKCYSMVEEMPSFPGGMSAMSNYLMENIQYPQTAKDKNTQGAVLLTFIVEKDGSVTNVTVKQSLSEACDAEAVRVVKAMPKWNPGKQDGKPVRVQFALPIRFQLK